MKRGEGGEAGHLRGKIQYDISLRKADRFMHAVCCKFVLLKKLSSVSVFFMPFSSDKSGKESSEDSDLEAPVPVPIQKKGRKRAAGIFKGTPVSHLNNNYKQSTALSAPVIKKITSFFLQILKVCFTVCLTPDWQNFEL